jgi:hypothetical protein
MMRRLRVSGGSAWRQRLDYWRARGAVAFALLNHVGRAGMPSTAKGDWTYYNADIKG